MAGFEKIDSVDVTSAGGSGLIEFTSVPQGYEHLYLVATMRLEYSGYQLYPWMLLDTSTDGSTGTFSGVVNRHDLWGYMGKGTYSVFTTMSGYSQALLGEAATSYWSPGTPSVPSTSAGAMSQHHTHIYNYSDSAKQTTIMYRSTAQDAHATNVYNYYRWGGSTYGATGAVQYIKVGYSASIAQGVGTTWQLYGWNT